MGIAIIGAGGVLRKILADARRTDPDLALFSETPAEIGTEAGGLPVLPRAALDAPGHRDRAVCLAIGDGAARRRLDAELRAAGRRFADIRAATALVDEAAETAEGLVLCAFALIEGGARVGRQFQGSIYSSVGHDCTVGDHVTFGPRAGCLGHVVVEDGAWIGAGALVRNGRPGRPLTVGAGATVGMGAVVMRDVPPGATALGNPARIVRRGRPAAVGPAEERPRPPCAEPAQAPEAEGGSTPAAKRPKMPLRF